MSIVFIGSCYDFHLKGGQLVTHGLIMLTKSFFEQECIMGVSGAYDSVVYAVPFYSRTVMSYIDLLHNLV